MPTVNTQSIPDVWDHAGRLRELENTVATIAQGLMALSLNLDRTETRLKNQHDAIQKLIEALNILTGNPSHDL